MVAGVVEPGRYRHWKGRDYEVIGIGIHTETNEEFVVYVDTAPSVEPAAFYLRPLSHFLTPADVDGQPVPRFVPVPRGG